MGMLFDVIAKRAAGVLVSDICKRTFLKEAHNPHASLEGISRPGIAIALVEQKTLGTITNYFREIVKSDFLLVISESVAMANVLKDFKKFKDAVAMARDCVIEAQNLSKDNLKATAGHGSNANFIEDYQRAIHKADYYNESVILPFAYCLRQAGLSNQADLLEGVNFLAENSKQEIIDRIFEDIKTKCLELQNAVEGFRASQGEVKPVLHEWADKKLSNLLHNLGVAIDDALIRPVSSCNGMGTILGLKLLPKVVTSKFANAVKSEQETLGDLQEALSFFYDFKSIPSSIDKLSLGEAGFHGHVVITVFSSMYISPAEQMQNTIYALDKYASRLQTMNIQGAEEFISLVKSRQFSTFDRKVLELVDKNLACRVRELNLKLQQRIYTRHIVMSDPSLAS